MIPLTRLNGGGLHLNPDLVATIEEHHDTVLTLTDGKCLVVAESAAEVIAAIVHHRAEILASTERLLRVPSIPAGPAPSGPAGRHHDGPGRVLSLRPGGQ